MREIHKRYKEQKDEERKQKQLTLFELVEDRRPSTQRTASDRFANPTMFEK